MTRFLKLMSYENWVIYYSKISRNRASWSDIKVYDL